MENYISPAYSRVQCENNERRIISLDCVYKIRRVYKQTGRVGKRPRPGPVFFKEPHQCYHTLQKRLAQASRVLETPLTDEEF
ncbi:hypothetical protein ScPMuIL_005743 [Solemya velum]